MSRSVSFNGVTAFRPGGLTRINANALTPIGLSATGIVHLLGEADGGAPGTGGVAIIDDPALAREIFRSGPLADAIRAAFNPSGDVRIPGGAFRVVAYKTNASVQSGTQLPGDEAELAGTAAAGSTTTVINWTGGGLVVNAHTGRWLQHDNLSEKRRIVSNTATAITVSPGFSAVPAAGNPLSILASQLILTSKDYGAHTNQLSVELEPGTGEGVVVTLAFEDTVEQSGELGGNSLLNLKYIGGPVFDTGIVDVLTATTLNLDVAVAPVLNSYAGMIIRFSDGTQRLVLSNSAADPSLVTLAVGHGLSTEDQLALEGTTAQIINVTSATASITGSNGVSTNLTSVVAPTADNLAISFSTLEITTLRQLVDYINGNTNYEASIPDGVNPDTTLASEYDFGDRNTAVDVRFDDEIDPDNKGSFRQDLQAVVDWFNDFSQLAAAAKATTGTDEGSELPSFTGGVSGTVRDLPVFFVGGSRGTSSNSSFQAGFDQLLQLRGNHIVPLISENLENEGNGSNATFASVAAQLKEHVKKARTTDKNEMGGYIGFKGTKTQIIAQAAAFNDTDVQLIPQQMSFLNVDGDLTTFPEWGSAVAAAGMRSGTVEVGEPLTFKTINTSTLLQDSSWSPTSRTDANQLIQAGVMFAEVTNSGVVRWVRDITTHIQDDNIAFIDGNTREAVRFVAFDLRQFLEDRFTGVKATPANAASIRDSVMAKMAEFLDNNIIVQSLDPETQSKVLPGYRNLRVFIEGNVATIRVEIFPVTGIVFQLTDIFLSLPRIAA